MKTTSNGGSRLHFGQLELDLSEGRLLRKGLPVRIENQPLQILATLLEHPGELVSREEFYARLWPNGTYVDFEEGLNTAIKKLRFALGDSAETPIFVETIPRKGYRFIAPVQQDAVEANEPSPSHGPDLPSIPTDVLATSPKPAPPDSKTRRIVARLLALALVIAAAVWLLDRLAFPHVLRVTQVTRLTSSGRLDPWGGIASDGSRLFFLEREGDHWNDRQISVAGGESAAFDAPFKNTKIFSVSPDQSELLLVPFASRDSNRPLWSMPLVGGAPRRIGDLVVDGAAYSPDGTKIAVTNTTGVYVANRDGSDLRQLSSLAGWAIDWSPNGKILRFSSNGSSPRPHLWQVSASGGNLHPFLPAWEAFDGHWTADGAYYIFVAPKNGVGSLWAVRDFSNFPWLQPAPTQLTFTPISYAAPLPSRDGNSIYAYGSMKEGIDVVHFDPVTHRSKPVLSGVATSEVAFSPDRHWMLYSRGNQLWRSRPDGSDRRQLVEDPAIPGIHGARWSPDSKEILFENSDDGVTGAIYLVSADGGRPQRLLPPDSSTLWPDWSSDGKTMVFSAEEKANPSSSSVRSLYIFDFEQRRSTIISGSEGLNYGRWSPDGRFLAALSVNQGAMKLLDLKTHAWTQIASGTALSFPVWSADSVLYFQDILAPGEPVYRFQAGGSGAQRVYSFEDILQAGAVRCGFWGFAPDGSLLVQVNRGGGDLYALSVNLP